MATKQPKHQDAYIPIGGGGKGEDSTSSGISGAKTASSSKLGEKTPFQSPLGNKKGKSCPGTPIRDKAGNKNGPSMDIEGRAMESVQRKYLDICRRLVEYDDSGDFEGWLEMYEIYETLRNQVETRRRLEF